MEQSYDVKFREEIVGEAEMLRQGLYTAIRCRCNLPDDGMYKLHLLTDACSISLGILYPCDGMFGLDTRLPSSKLGQGSIRFSLLPKDDQPVTVPVRADMPFAYLARLEQCRFLMIEGKACLVLPREKNG